MAETAFNSLCDGADAKNYSINIKLIKSNKPYMIIEVISAFNKVIEAESIIPSESINRASNRLYKRMKENGSI